MTAKRVSPIEAKALLDEGWTYIDVRTEEEFDAGHPAGSINIPINSPDFLAAMMGCFEPDSKLIIGCEAGGRSARACVLLESNGFQQLVDQAGGWGGQRNGLGRVVYAGWSESKLPVGGGTPFREVLKGKPT